MLKKISFSIMVMSIMMPLLGNAAGEIKSLAVINDQKIIFESIAGKDFTSKLEVIMENHVKKFQTKGEVLEKERDSLQKKQTILSREVFEKQEMEFKVKVTEYQKEIQSERNAIDAAKAKAFEQISLAAMEITREYAKSKSFDIILPISATLYFVDKSDVTEDILKMLNNKISKVDFKV